MHGRPPTSNIFEGTVLPVPLSLRPCNRVTIWLKERPDSASHKGRTALSEFDNREARSALQLCQNPNRNIERSFKSISKRLAQGMNIGSTPPRKNNDEKITRCWVWQLTTQNAGRGNIGGVSFPRSEWRQVDQYSDSFVCCLQETSLTETDGVTYGHGPVGKAFQAKHVGLIACQWFHVQ